MITWMDDEPKPGLLTPAEARRVVLWTLLTLFCLAALASAWRYGFHVEAAPIEEVTLAPIVVQMADPFPCSTNLRNRIAYQRLGAVCSGGDR